MCGFLERTDWLFRSPKNSLSTFITSDISSSFVFFQNSFRRNSYICFVNCRFFLLIILLKGFYRWRIVTWCLIAIAFVRKLYYGRGGQILGRKDQNQAAKMEFLEKRTENQFIKYVSVLFLPH